MALDTRPQFPRSSVSGAQPELLRPGSPAFNWPDRKMYVGDPGNQPLLFSQLIRPWQLGVVYAPGDIVLHDSEIQVAAVGSGPSEAFDPAKWTTYTQNRVSRFGDPSASGLLSGGLMTESSSTVIEVAAGSGLVIDATDPSEVQFTLVEWPAFTAGVAMTALPQTLVASIDASGALQLVDEATFDAEDRRSSILLGFVVTDEDEIVDILNLPLPALNTAETYRDEYQANGGPYRVSGVNLMAADADLTLMATAGVIFSIGRRFRSTPSNPNLVAQAERDPLDFDTIDRDGTVVDSSGSVVPGSWDNAGSVEAVPSGKATIQYVVQRTSEAVLVQLGQALYDSLNDALLNLGFDWEAFEQADASLSRIVLGAVVVLEGATDLSDLEQAVVVSANVGRGLPFPKQFRAAAQDLSGYLLRDGSAPMTGDLDMDGNAILNFVLDEGTF